MIVWLKKPDGTCVRLTDRWKPRMHVGGSYRDLVDLACKPYIEKCRFVYNYEKAGDLEKSRVLEVEVESDSEAARLANRIQREGNFSRFRLYDVDIPSPQVYLYRKNLFPLALVEADDKGDEVQWALRDSREILDYKLPPLSKIGLEVKTRKIKKIQTFQDELDSLQIEQNGGETFGIDSGSEAEKLLCLVDLLREIDPDIVTTKGGDSFIFPYLARRAQQNEMLDKLILGRDLSPLRVYEVQGHSYFSYGKILYKETAARLLGRIHLDHHNAFISADCGLEGLFEIARTCIIPIQRASRATIGTNMTSIQLYHAVRKEILIPWNKNQPEEWKDSDELVNADRGGFIYEPAFGIHDQVGELDFTSLYPTLMRDMNLSGETVNCKCCSNPLRKVPELDYKICDRAGIVPQSLDILLRRRTSYKNLRKKTKDERAWQKFDQSQSALKWILVCSFGYLGFKNARFGKIDAHIATCAFSRAYFDRAAAIAQAHGFKLVHGIVDSMWLTKPNATATDYEKLCTLIKSDLKVPLSFEGQYKWMVFLNSKIDPQAPVLNRYYGIFQDGRLKIRGIDLRRHDTPEIVRKCQNAMFLILKKANNSEEFRTLIPDALDVLRRYALKLQTGSVPIEDTVITRSLSKEPKEYTHSVPQAIAAQCLIDEGGSVHAGQQVSYILTRDGSKNSQTQALPAELADDDTVYDPKRYIDLLISSTANLLLPFGYNQKSLTASLS